jgi:hypothetical protein
MGFMQNDTQPSLPVHDATAVIPHSMAGAIILSMRLGHLRGVED